MASVRIKNITNVSKKIKETFNKIKTDPILLREIADVTIENIQGYARSGKNPETGQAFPKLSDGWVKKRKSLAKQNSQSGFFLGVNSKKSNVTFTGELLESLVGTIDRTKGLVSILAKGTHKAYAGDKNGAPKKNSEIIADLASRGFEFLLVSEKLKKRVNVLVKRFIRKNITSKKI